MAALHLDLAFEQMKDQDRLDKTVRQVEKSLQKVEQMQQNMEAAMLQHSPVPCETSPVQYSNSGFNWRQPATGPMRHTLSSSSRMHPFSHQQQDQMPNELGMVALLRLESQLDSQNRAVMEAVQAISAQQVYNDAAGSKSR